MKSISPTALLAVRPRNPAMGWLNCGMQRNVRGASCLKP
jgi:hypothetical protein